MRKIQLEELKRKAKLYRILSHPSRLCIVTNLVLFGDVNVSDMQNCLEEPQSTVSHHIAKLKDLKIIEGTRKGTQIYYKVIDKEIIDLIKKQIIQGEN